MVLWGEIKVDSDDLKHMVHRNGGFIELYNNIMTWLGDLGLLLAVPPLGSEWFGTEVGNKGSRVCEFVPECAFSTDLKARAAMV